MKSISENISNIRNDIKKILVIVIIVLTIVGVYLYTATFYITIRFDELGPLAKNMAVYYNGFKIGKIVHIDPDDDFKHTLVKVNLTQKKLKLPQNTTISVQTFPNGEMYLQFVYPSSPSFKTIRRGDVIEGTTPYSLEKFMLGQSISGVSDLVSLHIIKALNAMDTANMELESFFRITSKVIEENDKGIKASVNNTVQMTKNLAQMAENLNETSQKLNLAVDEKILKNTTANIEGATLNIKDTTENISKATKDIDKTIKKLDDTMTQINATAENLNSITSGVNETLSKRFGGMRVMFGRPVDSKKSKNGCN